MQSMEKNTRNMGEGGKTYSLRSPRQDPFRRSLQVPPMALEIPQNSPSVYLRKHLLYRFDRRFSFPLSPSLQFLR